MGCDSRVNGPCTINVTRNGLSECENFVVTSLDWLTATICPCRLQRYDELGHTSVEEEL